MKPLTILAAAVLLPVFSALAGPVIFYSDASIGASNTNYEGRDILVIGCTVTIDGVHGFTGLDIINGIVTHSPITNSLGGGLNLKITNDLTIDEGSSITVDGLGFGPGLGLGAGLSKSNFQDGFGYVSGGGGGYGGDGGSSFGGTPGGPAYGLLSRLTNAGSGGGAGFGPGGAGGGLVNLNVGGAFILYGSISANGSNGASLASGGGSGGSIFITAPSVSGEGTITANGGAGEPSDGGGGGGGRVVLQFQTNDFYGTINAHGGSGALAGAAGTINLLTLNGFINQVFVDNGGMSGTNTPLVPPLNCSLAITGGAIVSLSNTGENFSSLEIGSNSWMLAGGQQIPLQLTVQSNAVIEAGGGIDLSALVTVRNGSSGGVYSFEQESFGGGGGNGGNGGAGFGPVGQAVGGVANQGSLTEPETLGGIGGTGSGTTPYNAGGAGGGAVSLTVEGTLYLSGSILANGGQGLGEGSGGGAGGSVSVSAGVLWGAGMVSANGGDAGSVEGGGGAGGRIAISTLQSSTNQFAGTVSAYGGSGFQDGGAGAIYLSLIPAQQSKAISELLFDNGGLSGAGTPIANVLQNTMNLTITNGADLVLVGGGSGTLMNLAIGPNSSLATTNINVQFTVQSNAYVAAGGEVIAGVSTEGGGLEEAGGSYGGYGGPGVLGLASVPIYGSLQEPTTFGERGGEGPTGSQGGAGGGILNFTVNGTFFLNGAMTANGLPALLGSGAGGGSGGSIYVTATRLTGTGSMSANGGAGDVATGGGGSGGRIAVLASSNNFAGRISAFGAPGYVGGGAGTIYIAPNMSAIPQVIVDNGGLIGTNTPFISSIPNCDFTVADGAVAVIPNSSVSIRNLVLGSNGFIVPPTGQTSEFAIMVTSNTTIWPTGGIIFDGRGSSPGAGQSPGASITSNNIVTGGGGAGTLGYGGNSAFGAKGGGYMYDAGNELGSGGGAGMGSEPNNVGGAGGGYIALTVGNTLTLGGALSANGTMGRGEGSGGGGGGFVSVRAGTLTGNGTIMATGGAGQLPYGGGGGGGEIVVTTTMTNRFTGALLAHGGVGAVAGGAGVVFEQFSQNGYGQVVIDNAGLSGANTVFPTSFPSVNLGLYDIVITNGAIAALSENLIGSPRNLTIGSNSFLVGGSTASQTTAYSISLTGNATIQPGGGLVFDGDGYSSNLGPGAGKYTTTNGVSSTNGSGGGNGGNGGAAFGGIPGGAIYGIFTSPDGTGSGGGSAKASESPGGAGGGFIQLKAVGTLALGGRISANGTPGVASGSGGGSGGCISLTAGLLTGQGSITANGGAGQLPLGGGGGGGRIAIFTPSNQFGGLILAQGGLGYANGGAGTVYIAANTQPATSQLVINNGGLRAGATPPTLLSPLSQPGLTLSIQGGAAADISSSTVLKGLFVGAQSLLTQTNGFALYLNVSSNATVQAGGAIILNGVGSNPNRLGGGASTSSVLGYNTGGGGGHGGYGGNGFGGAAGGSVYDQFMAPIMLGSLGGAGANAQGVGAPGGGALNMQVTGTLDLEGLISANGAMASSEAGGGGSGGSVQLGVGGLLGSGTITANGGSGDLPNGGGGGGGRISVQCLSNLFTGVIQAYGGPGYVAGGAGTIWRLTAKSTPANALTIDNGGRSGTNTPISSTAPYDLTITGAAVVVPQTPGNMIVNSLLIESNSVLSHPSATGSVAFTVLNNATLASNAWIVVDGEGYNATNTGPGGGTASTNGIGGGGGHGGAGGGGYAGAPGGATNDSLTQPVLWGSAGGVASTKDPNLSQGGGAIDMTVNGTFTINGTVSADGNSALYPGAGGGAGGSIYLTAALLAGNGVLSADGGAGQGGVGGGGGGGRISLALKTNMFAGTMTVTGGLGYDDGALGTISLSTNLNDPLLVLAPAVPLTATLDAQGVNLVLQWSGVGGTSCQVEASTDLVHWQSYGASLVSSNGANTVKLPVGSDAGTFFRLVPTQ